MNVGFINPIFKQYEEQGHSSALLDLLAINVIGELQDVMCHRRRTMAGSYVGRKGSEGNDAIDRQTDMRMALPRSLSE